MEGVGHSSTARILADLQPSEGHTSPALHKAYCPRVVRAVFLQCSRENQDIAQVDTYEMVKLASENVTDESSENGWGVRETERHHLVLEVSKGGVERCLPLIPLLNVDQVVSVSKVQFIKNPGVTQRLKGWVSQG